MTKPIIIVIYKLKKRLYPEETALQATHIGAENT